MVNKIQWEDINMKCPACENELTEKIFANVPLDVCEGGCGGVWFDWFELQKFDDIIEYHAKSFAHRLGMMRYMK